MNTAPLATSRHIVDGIFGNLWFRKAYHFIAGGTLVALAVSMEPRWFTGFCLLWLITFGILSQRLSTAVLGFLLLHLATGSRFVTLGAGVVFVVGDGVAALVGSTFGVTPWPWRRDKTVTGSVAFLLCAAVAMVGVLRILSDAPWSTVLLIAFVSSVIGCFCEALPVTIRDFRDAAPDDNLLILLCSGTALYLLMYWFHLPLRPSW